MATTLGTLNPLTYRGYVYDYETNLYYLQSRYYSPEWGRFINADAFVSTGGLLGNNMFAYCCNNPVACADPGGTALKVCIDSQVNMLTVPWKEGQGGGGYRVSSPKRERIAVIYDGRHSGYLFGMIVTDGGFQHQGTELVNRLARQHQVEPYSYTTMSEFIGCWNSSSGEYDSIYIVGHGWAGGLSCAGESISYSGDDYFFSELNAVSVSKINLYCCNGATLGNNGKSTASFFATLTGATVNAVANGKLGFSWYGCYPELAKGAYWATVVG